jgi:hypothetical protein
VRKLFIAGIVLFVLAGVALAQTPPATATAAVPTASAVDAAKVSGAITDLDTAEKQLAGVEAGLYADLEVVAGILGRCGFTVSAVTSAPGTATYANERAAWADQIMSYCSDPATIAKVKPSLTDDDRQALSNVKVDLIGLQAQLTPILGSVTGAIAVLQNAVFGLPAMVAGGTAAGNVEELSKLLGEATTALTKAITLPANANKTLERINKLLGFLNMLL